MILPTPNPSFSWQQTPAGPSLVCQALSPLAAHLFTTRYWKLGSSTHAVSDDEGWGEIAAMLNGTVRVSHLRQVHGNRAVTVRTPEHERCEGDILLTDVQGAAVAVQAADCVPLLLVDARTGAVAAAHAGWRGMAARVPAAAIAALRREFGSRPADLMAAMGPSIGACCYEVGADVRDAFIAAGFSADQVARWFLDAPRRLPTNPSMPLASPRPNHWFFDGWLSVREQLEAEGVAADRVHSAELCTASHPEVLCSYRRTGRGTGRIAAVVTPAAHRP